MNTTGLMYLLGQFSVPALPYPSSGCNIHSQQFINCVAQELPWALSGSSDWSQANATDVQLEHLQHIEKCLKSCEYKKARHQRTLKNTTDKTIHDYFSNNYQKDFRFSRRGLLGILSEANREDSYGANNGLKENEYDYGDGINDELDEVVDDDDDMIVKQNNEASNCTGRIQDVEYESYEAAGINQGHLSFVNSFVTISVTIVVLVLIELLWF